MNEAELVNLLRNNTHLGRLAASEVREALDYMKSLGVVFPSEDRAEQEPAIESPRATMSASEIETVPPEDKAK